MTTTDLHVVLGASGGAGNAIARALHDAGIPVRAVNRSGVADLPPGITVVASDATAPEGVARAVKGAAVVYMAAQPKYHRWPQEFPSMLANVIDGVGAEGARLVMVDNLYGYGSGSGVMADDTPERATDAKGTVRRAMTESLLEAHRSGRLRVTIGRASDYFGPRSQNSAITALAIAPSSGGRSIRWMGSLDAPHSAAYLPDIARAYVILGTDDRADGTVWILPHAPAVTGREFLDLVNRTFPKPLKMGVISTRMLRIAAPVHKLSRESLGIVYQWMGPFIVDDSRFRQTFGTFEVTPLEDAVRTSVQWYAANTGLHG